jgi:hypothetical protein
MHGWDLERVGIIATAYSTAADIAAICQEPGRDFTQGEEAATVDHAQTQTLDALREVLRLTGLDEKEIARRMEIAQARHRGAR